MNAPTENINELIDRHLDGELSAEEGALLASRLKTDAEAARTFARAALMHDQARAIIRYDRQHTRAAPEPYAVRLRGVYVAAGIALLTATALFLLPKNGQPPQRSHSPSLSLIAQLDASTEAAWSDPDVGWTLEAGDLPPGPLHLESGRTEFRFGKGPRVLVEGPALFEPLGPDRLSLLRGRLVARITGKSPLAVIAPHARVTGIGAVLAVAVDRDEQSTRVAVLEGNATVQAGDRRYPMRAGQAMIVAADGHTAADPGAFAQLAGLFADLPSGPAATKSSENLLVDPGLETEPRTKFEPRTPDNSPWLAHRISDRVPDLGRGGSGAGRIRALGNRGWPFIKQEIETGDLSGRLVTASVWAMHPANDPLSDRQHAIVKVTFVDALGREMQEGKAERHFLRADEPAEQWVQSQVSSVAPPEARAIRIILLLNARSIATGSVFFDDATLTVAPPTP